MIKKLILICCFLSLVGIAVARTIAPLPCEPDPDNEIYISVDNKTGKDLWVNSRFIIKSGVIYTQDGDWFAISCKQKK